MESGDRCHRSAHNHRLQSTKTNVQPRVGATYSLTPRTVVRGGFGMFVGPGQTEDQIQTIGDSDRVSSTISSGAALVYPLDPNVAIANFVNNPNNRNYQPRAYRDDTRFLSGSGNTPVRCSRTGREYRTHRGLHRVAGTQSVPPQHREPYRRGVHQSQPCQCRNRGAPVLDRDDARCGRQADGRSEPVRGNRYEDERRRRQLQRLAARSLQAGRRAVSR